MIYANIFYIRGYLFSFKCRVFNSKKFRSSVVVSPKTNKDMSYWWNHFTSPETKVIVLIVPVKGQGL